MRALTVALFFLSLTSIAQTTCLDPLACNFTEIGDCVYLDIDGLPCVSEGCAIPGACNFDPEADINDGSCEFTSCLGCTDETACNYEPEALYLDLSCIYYVDCNGTCGGNMIEDECGNCFDPPLCLNLSGVSEMMNETPLWHTNEFGLFNDLTLESGLYLVEIAGASGGSTYYGVGGLGVHFVDTINIENPTVLSIVVGEHPLDGSSSGGGGGGGSFIYFNNQLLVAAGGGGGAGGYNETIPGDLQDGIDATLLECGTDGQISYGEHYTSDGLGGCDGQGGSSGISHRPGGGGGGFISDGTSYTVCDGGCGWGYGGSAVLNGAAGGTGEEGVYDNGGFGGGGGAALGGGGGGGYSGGGGGTWSGYNSQDWGHGGGGGGSLCSSFVQELNFEPNQGHGFVRIWACGANHPACVLGCVVEQACNYNPEATNDDGSCAYPDDCGVCGGDNSSCLGCTVPQACNFDSDALIDDGSCDFCFCGPGTAWDNLSEQCLIVEGSSDIDGDGCTNLSDLLDLLSDYGICLEPEFAACGDPISHEGYDYSTVLIGEQCWFSENCRYLPAVSPSSEGSETDPYYYVYDYQGTDVEAAKSTSNYDTYGVLYNWPAVMTDEICPTSWHIPSNGEWTQLTDFLGDESVAGDGDALKSTSGWNNDGNGSNSSGFTGLPGGNAYSGSFNDSGNYAQWWSASGFAINDLLFAWLRQLYVAHSNVDVTNAFRSTGYSARCIKD